jgi:hypothetical protein
MPKILLDHSDGLYSTRVLNDEKATELEAQGVDVAYVDDSVLAGWLRHCDASSAWQALWRAIANEQALRRRERELLPLEDAQREIARLQEELARAQRMEKFYGDRYAEQLSAQHREEYDAYTCVFPQPGCQVDALRPEWQECAQEILEQYNTVLAAEGMRVQGCCCGHAHKKLDDAAVAQLRNCGFLVEHNSEPT